MKQLFRTEPRMVNEAFVRTLSNKVLDAYPQPTATLCDSGWVTRERHIGNAGNRGLPGT